MSKGTLETMEAKYQEVGAACGFRLYATDTGTIERLASEADRLGIDVQRLLVGETVPVGEGLVVSQRAGPCLTGLVRAEGGLRCFHSDKGLLTEEQFALIQAATDGLAGSAPETIQRYRGFLESHHLQVIEPPESPGQQTDFNFVVVTTNLIFAPRGIYYAYS